MCTIHGCENIAVKRGWCHGHYMRWYRHGDPLLGRASKTPGKSAAYPSQWVNDYKVRVGCADCGYNAHPAALDFDHLPGAVKTRDIRSGQNFGWQALMDEIEKCEVVCANCHRIRTVERQARRIVLIRVGRGRCA